MICTVPLCSGKLAPLFEYADEIFVFDVRHGSITSKTIIPVNTIIPEEQVELVSREGTSFVFCCRMKDFSRKLMKQAGIHVLKIHYLGVEPEDVEKYICKMTKTDDAPNAYEVNLN